MIDKSGLIVLGVLALVLFVPGCSRRVEGPQGKVSAEFSKGAAVFAENCAVCHSLPILDSLLEQNRGRAPGFVYDALSEGNMRRMGAGLDDASRRAVAEFFTGVSFSSPEGQRDFSVSPPCGPDRNHFDWHDQGYPSWGGNRRNLRSIPDDQGLAREEVSSLEVAWVVAFPESSQLRSQATAAGGALFVGSHNGSVYALDQETGCTRWQFKAATEVRSAVTIDRTEEWTTPRRTEPDSREAVGDGNPVVRAVFADRAANVYALNAETGELLWKQSVDPHPNAAVTGSVSAFDGLLYVPMSSNDDINSLDPDFPCCTHSGAVVALDSATGEILWRTGTVDEAPRITGKTDLGTDVWGPSGASVWNTPTIAPDLGLLFVGSGNNHSRPATGKSDSVLAMDLRTGRIAWTYQSQAGDAWNAACLFGNRSSCPDPEGPDTDFGATTLLLELDGRDVLIAGQKSGLLHALNPATGSLQWKVRLAPGGAEGGIRYGMATQDGVIYVPSADAGAHMLGGVSTARETQPGRFSYEPGVFAVSAIDGSLIWSTTGPDLCTGQEACSGAVASPPLSTRDVVFASGLDGVLYALDRKSGELFWSFDTDRSFSTLLGRTTHGGGMAGTAGPILAGGRLFVSSGYGQAQRPGNALIAFAPARRRANQEPLSRGTRMSGSEARAQ